MKNTWTSAVVSTFFAASVAALPISAMALPIVGHGPCTFKQCDQHGKCQMTKKRMSRRDCDAVKGKFR